MIWLLLIFIYSLDKSKAFALHGHGGPIYDLVEIAKAKVLLSASNDKTIRVWDLKSKLCLEVYKWVMINFLILVVLMLTL